jgi:hypothetical protein
VAAVKHPHRAPSAVPPMSSAQRWPFAGAVLPSYIRLLICYVDVTLRTNSSLSLPPACTQQSSATGRSRRPLPTRSYMASLLDCRCAVYSERSIQHATSIPYVQRCAMIAVGVAEQLVQQAAIQQAAALPRRPMADQLHAQCVRSTPSSQSRTCTLEGW